MASKIDQLLSAFELVVNESWATTLSGQERIWFLVYDPSEQRKIDLRLEDFETATMKSGRRWFGIIIIVSLIGGVIGLILGNDILMFSFFFIAIVTSRSLKKKNN